MKLGAHPRVEHMKIASLRQTLMLLTNIGLGWKGMAGSNNLDYYEHLLITNAKSFITLTPEFHSNDIPLALLANIRLG